MADANLDEALKGIPAYPGSVKANPYAKKKCLQKTLRQRLQLILRLLMCNPRQRGFARYPSSIFPPVSFASPSPTA
jgi:hypothetical protein